MITCSYCEENRRSRCNYADCPFEVEQANETIARLQEQLEAVTREKDHWKLTASVESGKVAFRDSRFVTLEARAEAAEARAARLEAALRRISDMCPATQEMTVAHMMADEAEAALDVKEAG